MDRKALSPFHKSPPLVPVLIQMNPIHTLQPKFPKIYFDIKLASMPRSSKWSFLFRLSNQNFMRISHIPKVI